MNEGNELNRAVNNHKVIPKVKRLRWRLFVIIGGRFKKGLVDHQTPYIRRATITNKRNHSVNDPPKTNQLRSWACNPLEVEEDILISLFFLCLVTS